MSSNEFLLSHGEKLALAVMAGLSAWAVYGTLTNPEIHPRDVSDLVIDGMINNIESKRSVQPAPQIKTPPNYVAALRSRLEGQLPAVAYMPWLTGQPDVGPVIGNKQPLYIYELLPPRLSGRELGGAIELTVAMPESIHKSEDNRIADGYKREWKSQGGKVVNSVERAGVYIEYCIGGDPRNGVYKPLEAEGIVGGFAPMPDSDHPSFKVEFKADAVWETYHLKIRLVARATGYPLGRTNVDQSPQAVLVCAGRFGPVTMATMPDLEARVRKGDADALARFVQPFAKPFDNASLKPGEGFFLSNESTISLAVTSATRFAFDKSFTASDNTQGATMLVTTLLQPLPGSQANKTTWLLKPEVFKIKKDEKLGSERLIEDPRKQGGVKSRIDLSTPFVLEEIKTDVQRTLYYELDTTARATGGGQRDLVLKAKSRATEAAVLKNAATGQTRPFTRLLRIEKPAPKLPSFMQLVPGNWIKLDGPFIYPDFDGLGYDESIEFLKNPAGFKQRELIPTAPVWHVPEAGPLIDQRKRGGDDYQTDTKYIEFADGRVFFWEPINKRIVSFVIPNSEAERALKERKAAPPSATPPPIAPPAKKIK